MSYTPREYLRHILAETEFLLCVFRGIPPADSGPSRPLIPAQVVQPFRSMSSTDSGHCVRPFRQMSSIQDVPGDRLS